MADHQKKHDTTYEGNLLAEKDTPQSKLATWIRNSIADKEYSSGLL